MYNFGVQWHGGPCHEVVSANCTAAHGPKRADCSSPEMREPSRKGLSPPVPKIRFETKGVICISQTYNRYPVNPMNDRSLPTADKWEPCS